MKKLLLSSLCLFCLNVVVAQNCIDCTLIDPDAVCIGIFDPVCGCDGVTYSNDCVAQTQGGVMSWMVGECAPDNVSVCSDLANVDLGNCEDPLGYAVINGVCTSISGCGGIDAPWLQYAAALYDSVEECNIICNCATANSIAEHERVNLRIALDGQYEQIRLFFDTHQEMSFDLIDSSGRTVASGDIANGEGIGITALSSGFYIVLLKNSIGILATEKLMIRR